MLTTATPCLRFDIAENGDGIERSTLIEVEDFGDGGVGFHVSPRENDVQTTMLSIEDGWRFVREFVRALAQAELED